MTQTIQAWCDGQPNRGWFVAAGDKSVDLDTLQAAPELAVTYIPPAARQSWPGILPMRQSTDVRDPELAMAYARRAQRLSPNDPESQIALGAALCRGGQWDKAMRVLESTIKLNGPDPRATMMLALTYAQRSYHQTARRLLAHPQVILERTAVQDADLHALAPNWNNCWLSPRHHAGSSQRKQLK